MTTSFAKKTANDFGNVEIVHSVSCGSDISNLYV
jgi:hypothetical protein